MEREEEGISEEITPRDTTAMGITETQTPEEFYRELTVELQGILKDGETEPEKGLREMEKLLGDFDLLKERFQRFEGRSKEEWQVESDAIGWWQYACIRAAQGNPVVFGRLVRKTLFDSARLPMERNQTPPKVTGNPEYRMAVMRLIRQGGLLEKLLDEESADDADSPCGYYEVQDPVYDEEKPSEKMTIQARYVKRGMTRKYLLTFEYLSVDDTGFICFWLPTHREEIHGF